MFDTVTIHAKILNISNNAELIVQEPSYDFKSKTQGIPVVLYRDISKVIEGSKAFCNAENFNLTLKRNLNPRSPNPALAILQFSLPRQIKANNLQPVDDQDFPRALLNLDVSLEEKGFSVDLENSKLIRFDCARNVNTIFTSNQFVNLFSSHDLSRFKKQVYPSSILYYNNNTELNIYDKEKEQGIVSRNSFSSTCRFEMRTKTAKACEQKHKAVFLRDLLRNYKSIKKSYVDFVVNRFFDPLCSADKVNSYDLNSIFDFFKNNSKRNFTQNFFHFCAFSFLCENGMQKDFSALLKTSGVSRNNISIINRRFERMSVIYKQFAALKKEMNYFDYVRELKTNFVKAS